MSVSVLSIEPLPKYTRVFDILMVPIMFVLRGFKLDSLQETHAWHVKHLNLNDIKRIDLKLAAMHKGTDATIYHGRYSFLFHAPIFGGWKSYVVFEVDASDTPFHIGWIVRNAETHDFVEAGMQRLPINATRIRMLAGPPSYQTYFFAVNQSGEQIPLRKVGQGRLGDGNYLDVRLF